MLGTAVHGSANCPNRAGADHVETVRLLVDAGARILAEAGHLATGTEAVTALLEARPAER